MRLRIFRVNRLQAVEQLFLDSASSRLSVRTGFLILTYWRWSFLFYRVMVIFIHSGCDADLRYPCKSGSCSMSLGNTTDSVTWCWLVQKPWPEAKRGPPLQRIGSQGRSGRRFCGVWQ